jgi:septal ring factor EnvC (AmiA/AmiB activator)
MRRALLATALFALALGRGYAAPGDNAGPPFAQPAAPSGSPSVALAALDRKVADIDAEEQSAKKELDRLQNEVGETQARVIKRGRAYVRLTRAGLLPVGSGFDGLVRHAMQVELVRHALVRDLDAQAHLRSRSAELARVLERANNERASLAGQRSSTDAAQLAMDDESRQQEAFDQAFESPDDSKEYVAVYGGQAGPGDTTGGFAAAKGRLLFPLVGRAEVRSARREGADGPGLEVRAPMGSVVRAVYRGRVAFADRYGPYGRIVILDHGDHYYSVSGNLAVIDVHVGQEVPSGDRVGTVGDEGQGPMLYFEVRFRSHTVPPGPWLGLFQ